MKKLSPHLHMNRRHFLAATGLALAAPALIPAGALGREDKTAASERITLGVVGWGTQGPGDTGEALKLKDCQVVAACDLDANHLRDAVNKINGHYKNKDCRPYHDYRELMARRDIDAVILAVPDSWHALVATEARRNKKDIYGEKPLARTIAEQQAIVRAVKAERPHLANRLVAALRWGLPPGGRDRPQRPDRKGHPRRSGPPRTAISMPRAPATRPVSRNPRPNWITIFGSARPGWSPISRPAST